MKRHSFVISAIILTAGGFFAKAIGALYKIPLTNILGSNGIGLYYLVFPVYSLIITFCSSGISVAVATEVARCRKRRHRYNEQKILQVAIVISFILSLVLTFMIIALSGVLSEMQGNVSAKVGYVAIAPAIILSTLIATLRGYFQGIENMIPTTISLIIEQVVKLTFGLVLAHKLAIYGINYAVLGAILGVTISEVVAVAIIVINFLLYKGGLDYNYRKMILKEKRSPKENSVLKEDRFDGGYKIYKAYNMGFGKMYSSNAPRANMQPSHKDERVKFYPTKDRHRYTTFEAIRIISRIAIPSTFSALILPISTLIDSFLIINTLTSIGVSTTASTALYGIYGGVVQSLVSIPIIIITAISTSLVPSLSGLVVYGERGELDHRIGFFIKITWVIALLAFALVFAFSEGILKFLYGGGLGRAHLDEFAFAVTLLRINSVSIIYSAFLQTFTTILQVTGGASIPFWASLALLPLKIVCLKSLVVIGNINIYGAVISNLIYLACINIVLIVAIKKKIGLRSSLYFHLLKPLFISAIIATLGAVGYYLLARVINYFFAMIVLALILAIAYIIWIYYGRVLTAREKKYFIFRNKLCRSKNKPPKSVDNG